MISKQRPWKIVALVSSSLLIAAFVAYRAGAFATDAGPAATSTPPARSPQSDTARSPGTSMPEPVAPGKSAAELPPAPTTQTKPTRTFFPGSKSLIGLPSEESAPKPPEATPPAPKPEEKRAPAPGA